MYQICAILCLKHIVMTKPMNVYMKLINKWIALSFFFFFFFVSSYTAPQREKVYVWGVCWHDNGGVDLITETFFLRRMMLSIVHAQYEQAEDLGTEAHWGPVVNSEATLRKKDYSIKGCQHGPLGANYSRQLLKFPSWVEIQQQQQQKE